MRYLGKVLAAAAVLSILTGTSISLPYDGLWFLGFNTNKDVFGDTGSKQVRKAFNHAINRVHICKDIIGDVNVPTGVIPAWCEGSDGTLKGYDFDPGLARSLLRKAGYRPGDPRLRDLVLIHTDGIKTQEIAKSVKRDLKDIGIKIQLKQIPYSNSGEWENTLASGKYHMFLMGYKFLAGKVTDESSSLEAIEGPFDSAGYIRSLFSSGGEANMFFLRDKTLDYTLEYIGLIPSTEAAFRTKKLKDLNWRLQENPVTVNLFYIKKI